MRGFVPDNAFAEDLGYYDSLEKSRSFPSLLRERELNMATKYLLHCETIHCFGRRQYQLGETTSLQEAQKWVQEREQNYKRSQLPSEEHIRSCPVVHCPFKQQRPSFSYQESHE